MTPEGRLAPPAHVLEYMGLSLLSGGFSSLPHGLAVHAGDFLGRLANRVVPLRRKVADENLAAAFPALETGQRRKLLRQLYRHLGRTLAEFCRYPVLNPKVLAKRIRVDGEEHLNAAVAGGRGVLLLTAHLGNWEYLGAGLAARGFPMTFLVGPHSNRLAQELFNRYRGLNDVQVLVTEGSDLRAAFRALKAGRVVATVADQDAGPGGYFVDFFGRPASAALGPFRIARKTGAPVVFAFDVRHGMNHVITIDPPLHGDPGTDPIEESREWAHLYHARLEEIVARHPEQWFWVHRRWRSRPPAA